MSHTKGFLKVSGTGHVVGENKVICLDASPEDARRIVACWNACAGIATRDLETKPLFTDGYMVMFEEVTKQRDELLAALKDLHKAYRMAVGLHSGQDDAYTVRSHNAIAKVKS